MIVMFGGRMGRAGEASRAWVKAVVRLAYMRDATVSVDVGLVVRVV